MEQSPASPASISGLDPAQFSRLSELLDESIELGAEARTSWLSELDRVEPVLAAILRDMFAAQGQSRAQEFLETQDFVARDLSAVIAGGAGLIGKRFGPYRVLSLLGLGGMGSVWLAERVDGMFAASERARIDDWPDEAYRTWRYQRASLARLLANEGMMRDVADAYEQSGSRR